MNIYKLLMLENPVYLLLIEALSYESQVLVYLKGIIPEKCGIEDSAPFAFEKCGGEWHSGKDEEDDE